MTIGELIQKWTALKADRPDFFTDDAKIVVSIGKFRTRVRESLDLEKLSRELGQFSPSPIITFQDDVVSADWEIGDDEEHIPIIRIHGGAQDEGVPDQWA